MPVTQAGHLRLPAWLLPCQSQTDINSLAAAGKEILVLLDTVTVQNPDHGHDPTCEDSNREVKRRGFADYHIQTYLSVLVCEMG